MRILLVLFVFAWTPAAMAGYETLEAPLVGGDMESGWPAVGAMTYAVPGVTYMGSFCSGTLIREDWVLTAAHCLQGDQGQIEDARAIRFMVGDDSRPVDGLNAPEGAVFHQTDKLIVHPQYDPNANLHDIALVHLVAPVTDVAPIAYPNDELPKTLQGEELFYVGFGVENGETYEGGGVKRSGWIPLWLFDELTFLSEFQGTGVCFGDSGGPALHEFEDGWKVIGVNSWVMGGGADPCLGISVQTRVDVHRAWVTSTMAKGGPDCNEEPGLCWCPLACAEDGSCDNTMCETGACGDALDCALVCEEWDLACRLDCYLAAAPSEKALLGDLLSCLAVSCMGATIYNIDQGCPQVTCGDPLDRCAPTPAGEGTCRDIVTCAAACEPGDGDCRFQCLTLGTKTAQGAYGSYADCTAAGCGTWPAPGAEMSCDWAECSVYLETCLPPTDCSQMGGGCPPGTACREAPTGSLGCFPTEDIQEGEACDPEAAGIQCANGLGCWEDTDGAAKCLPLCGGPGGCGEDAECGGEGPVPGHGICLCLDEDEDGVCKAADCDDLDPGAHPGGGERCYDGVDNNCDGEVDEGCPVVEPDEGGGGGCGAAGSGGGGLWWLLMMVALVAALPPLRRLRRHLPHGGGR